MGRPKINTEEEKKEKRKAYYLANKEKIDTYNKQRYIDNKDEINKNNKIKYWEEKLQYNNKELLKKLDKLTKETEKLRININKNNKRINETK